MTNVHVPVLQKEVIQYLDPKPNENFIDCTIGGGGHTLAILEKTAPKGKVLGIDADSEVLKNTKYNIQNTIYKNRVRFVCDNFANLKGIVHKNKFQSVDGILFDLGMSSWHLEISGRGFSFLKNEPLDMRYTTEISNSNSQFLISNLTAEQIVNYWSFQDIEKILREYGEEVFAEKIAHEIIKERSIKPITNTLQLAEIIKKATPTWYHHKKIHPATRTFQTLRIAVNDELNNLKKALPQAVEILKTGGRLLVISFHSLEDRIVKEFCKSQSSISLKIINKKPITASQEEIKVNPRSRSAKLRAAIKEL